jgi:predicted ATPase
VILLEDIHWADKSSLLFLESLFRMVKEHPILFINILRPGYKETGDYLLNYLDEQLPDHHETLILESLNDHESGELIKNLLSKKILPSEVNELIIRKTQGNPFFIEEIIRSFIDTGIVEIHENEFRITEKIHTVDIPAGINDVILARIDKLDEKTRELLKTASVIGRNFYFKVLEEAGCESDLMVVVTR